MVEELENEIAVYESETGRPQTNVSTVSGSFSGYTASLITAVTKLMGYLKEVCTIRITIRFSAQGREGFSTFAWYHLL